MWQFNDKQMLAAELNEVATQTDLPSRVFSTDDVHQNDISSKAVVDVPTTVVTTADMQNFWNDNAGKVIVLPEYFDFDDRLQIPDNTAILECDGGSTMEQTNPDLNSNCIINATGAKDITLRFHLKGNGDGTPSGPDGAPTGLLLKETENINLTGMRFSNHIGAACSYQGVKNLTAYRCDIYDCGRGGFVGWSLPGSPLENIYLLFNTVENCGDDMYSIQGSANNPKNGTLITGDWATGSYTVSNLSGHSFTSADLGKLIAFEDGGYAFETTVATVVSATEITVTDSPPGIIAGGDILFGHVRSKNINLFNNYGMGRDTPHPNSYGRGIHNKGATDILAGYNSISHSIYTGLYVQYEAQVSPLYRGRDLRYYNCIFDQIGKFPGAQNQSIKGARLDNVDNFHSKNLRFSNWQRDSIDLTTQINCRNIVLDVVQ